MGIASLGEGEIGCFRTGVAPFSSAAKNENETT